MGAYFGYPYCIGTRAEAGVQPLVLDEIHNYGRKGRIFMAHFRNVRGSLATAGAYEEVHLDDGDMNMFKILQALHNIGGEVLHVADRQTSSEPKP